MPVEAARPEDREPILAVTRSAAVFNAEEEATVAELFDGYLRDARLTGYNFVAYRSPEDGEVIGFACWGPTALSKGAADLYWIATSQAAQGRGVGGALFRAVEDAARAAGRWLIVIWTSGEPAYAPARAFYQRMGCELSARIADFYDQGDDLCVFVRRL